MPDPLLQLVMSATMPPDALDALCEIVLSLRGEQVDVTLMLQGEVSAARRRLLEHQIWELHARPGVTMRTPLLRELPLRPEEKHDVEAPPTHS